MMDKEHGWFVKNLANSISIGRLIGVFVVLFLVDWDLSHKLQAYVALEMTDAIDGWVARKLRVNAGIGRVIDSSVDKFTKVMILVFFFKESLLSSKVVGAIALGELFVLVIAGYAIYLMGKYEKIAYEKQERAAGRKNSILTKYHSVAGRVRKGMINRWGVNVAGKIAMIFYFIMAVLIFGNIEFFDNANALLEFLAMTMFWGGILSRGASIVIFARDFYEWQKSAMYVYVEGGA
jgi:phosphatidylglycerophosphate synthase